MSFLYCKARKKAGKSKNLRFLVGGWGKAPKKELFNG